MELAGKTALITGSGAVGGLGHATAMVMAAQGAKVILTGVDPERGAEVEDDLGAAGGEAVAATARFVAADLADAPAVRELVESAGPVDILVNNASVMTFSPTVEQDLASYDAAFAVNVRAAFLLTALIAPRMAANGGGSIVNVSSTAASLGMPGMAVYGATKAAVESLTRTWAAEFASANVRVNAVAPGPMRTSKVGCGNGAGHGWHGPDHRSEAHLRPGRSGTRDRISRQRSIQLCHRRHRSRGRRPNGDLNATGCFSIPCARLVPGRERDLVNRLDGKYALITGGTSGIGLETARQFLAEGAHVAITGRSRDRLDEAARHLASPVLTIVSDAGDVPGQAALTARLQAEWPKLDILMSNAADITHLPIEQWTEEAFDRLVTTNLKSPFFLIRDLLPLFSRQASIILVGSVSAFIGHENATVYGAAKAGLLSTPAD